MRRSSSACRTRSRACCRRCRGARSSAEPRRPRRADPHPRPGRRLRGGQPDRARTPGDLDDEPERWAALIRHAGAILPRPALERVARRLLRRPQPRAATARTARFSSPSGVRLPEAHQPDPRLAGRCAHAREVARGWPTASGCRRTRPARGCGSAVNDVSGVVPDLSVIRDGACDQRLRGARLGRMTKLDAMENPFELPPEVVASWASGSARWRSNRYRRPTRRVQGETARSIDLRGHGAAARQRLGRTDPPGDPGLAPPGATVLSPWPSFEMYTCRAASTGWPLRRRAAGGGLPLPRERCWRLSPLTAGGGVRQLAQHPTGNLFDAPTSRRCSMPRRGWVVLDEAYLPFAQNLAAARRAGEPAWCCARCRDGLAGIRSATCAVTGVDRRVQQVRPPYNVNVLTLAAASSCSTGAACSTRGGAGARGARAGCSAAGVACRGDCLDRRPISSCSASPAGSAAADRVFARLKASGILIKNRAHVQPAAAGCLRVTVGLLPETTPFSMRWPPACRPTMTARTAEVVRNTARRDPRSGRPRRSGRAQLATGIGFFDHMPSRCRHAALDCDRGQGRPALDGHHTSRTSASRLARRWRAPSATEGHPPHATLRPPTRRCRAR